jgi:hypothetical protein
MTYMREQCGVGSRNALHVDLLSLLVRRADRCLWPSSVDVEPNHGHDGLPGVRRGTGFHACWHLLAGARGSLVFPYVQARMVTVGSDLHTNQKLCIMRTHV